MVAAPLLPGFPVQIANRYNIMCLSRAERRLERRLERSRAEGEEYNDDDG